MKAGMSSSFEMSKAMAEALSLPCWATNSSSRSCLRPTAVTFLPWAMKWSAMPLPIPLVAPITRTCLYWKGIFGMSDEMDSCLNELLYIMTWLRGLYTLATVQHRAYCDTYFHIIRQKFTNGCHARCGHRKKLDNSVPGRSIEFFFASLARSMAEYTG